MPLKDRELQDFGYDGRGVIGIGLDVMLGFDVQIATVVKELPKFLWIAR
jgi:hypothetical protein